MITDWQHSDHPSLGSEDSGQPCKHLPSPPCAPTSRASVSSPTTPPPVLTPTAPRPSSWQQRHRSCPLANHAAPVPSPAAPRPPVSNGRAPSVLSTTAPHPSSHRAHSVLSRARPRPRLSPIASSSILKHNGREGCTSSTSSPGQGVQTGASVGRFKPAPCSNRRNGLIINP